MGWAPKSLSVQIRLIHVEIIRLVVNFPTMSDMDAVQNQMLYAALTVLLFLWFITVLLIFPFFWQSINYKNNLFLYFSYSFYYLYSRMALLPSKFYLWRWSWSLQIYSTSKVVIKSIFKSYSVHSIQAT